MSLRVNRNFLVALPTAGALALFTGIIATSVHGQELPSLINVVDYTKLLALLPEAPAGWTADKPNGSTTVFGGFKLTNVHRDYRKGEGDNVPTTAISILDSAANPDYVEATTAAWKFTTTSTEGTPKRSASMAMTASRHLRRRQTRHALADGGEPIFCPNRNAGTGSRGASRMGQTRRYQKTRHD